MRKRLSVLLCAVMTIALLVGVMPATVALAAGDPVIARLTTVGDPVVIGNTVTVTVSLSANEDVTNLSVMPILTGMYVAETDVPTNLSAGNTKECTIAMNINPYLEPRAYSVPLRLYYTRGTESSYVDFSNITVVKTSAVPAPDNGTSDPDVETNDKTAVILDPTVNSPVLTGKPGETVRMTLNLFNRSALTISEVQVTPVVSTDVEKYPFVIQSNNNTRHLGNMLASGKGRVSFDFTVSDKATNGTKVLSFTVSYVENKRYYEFPIEAYINITGASSNADDQEDPTVPLVLAGKNEAGKAVTTPTGDAGDKVTVTLPIKNRSGSNITDIEIYPSMSADVNQFPFEIQSASYDRRISSLKAGQTKDVTYSFKLAEKATSGVKAVKYSVIYRDAAGASHQIELTSYVNVRKGYTEANSNGPVGPNGELLVVQPKLIITSYNLPEKIYAGEEFDLTLTLKNASDVDPIKNLKCTFKDEGGKILPAQGGSNTLFIRALSPGEETTQTIRFQSAPDIESKSHSMGITFEYNNGSVNAFTSNETVSIPVKQMMRVSVDEPRIYVEGTTVNNPFNATLNIYNKGKSVLYNVTLKLESEGETMRLEEGFYGGNLQPGSSTTADINIIPSASGDLFGKFIVQYEDEYGEVYTTEKEFTAYIMEEMTYDEPVYDPSMDPGMMEPQNTGMSTGLKIGIGVAAAAVLVALIVLLRRHAKKKREKELAE